MEEARRKAYLTAMGVTVWKLRDPPAAVAPETMVSEAEPLPAPERTVGESTAVETAATAPMAEPAVGQWSDLRARVSACSACGLRAGCTQTVFGVGNTQADLLIIGEAPGADEDRQGEPFVGPAGQLLNAMLLAMGFRREEVFIANILKCRPPNNRDPKPDEALQCEPFLRQQIAFIQPKVILSVGRISAHNLLKTDIPVGRLRGRIHNFGESATPLVVTYHPAYLLRSPEQKAKSWQDLQLALSLLREQ